MTEESGFGHRLNNTTNKKPKLSPRIKKRLEQKARRGQLKITRGKVKI